MTSNLTKVCSKKVPEKRWEPELSPGGEESVCGMKGQNPTHDASEEWHGEAMHRARSESAHISSISMSCSIRTLLRLSYILGPSKWPSSHFIIDKNRLYEYKLLHFAKMQCTATNWIDKAAVPAFGVHTGIISFSRNSTRPGNGRGLHLLGSTLMRQEKQHPKTNQQKASLPRNEHYLFFLGVRLLTAKIKMP